MKRNLFFIGMGAMALATPLFLSSCSSSDDIADNPGNTTGEAVKTSFTLSVGMPGGNSSSAKAIQLHVWAKSKPRHKRHPPFVAWTT